MRLPEVQWDVVLPLLERLHAQAPGLLRSVEELPVQTKFTRSHAGDSADALVAQGVLREVAPGGQLLHTGSSRGLRVLLRAARACEVVDVPEGDASERATKDYLARNFTGPQRSVVLDGEVATTGRARKALVSYLSSVHWCRLFLEIADHEAFDAPRAAKVYGSVMDPALHAAVCRLVRSAAPAPLKIPQEVSTADGPLIASAIETAIRYLVLFPRFGDEGLELGLLPCVAEDLLSESEGPPAVVEGGMPPARSHLLEDAESVFVRACTHPIRVKASGSELYQRDTDELIESLASASTRLGLEARVVGAVNALMQIGALEHGKTATARRCLVPTATGHEWISASLVERLEPFIAPVRAPTPSQRLRRLGLVDDYFYFSEGDPEAIWDALLDFYRGLPRGGGVPVEDHLAYTAKEENPMSTGGEAETTWRQGAWRRTLDTFVDWLGALGGLTLAQHEGEAVVGACPLGDYILGLAEEPPKPEASDARVVVQPNYDIVFLGPAPGAEAALARFSDRSAPGQVGTLFRITPESVMRAGAAGMTLPEIERALAENTDGAPANVLREVKTWLSRVRRVRATSGIVIECPDTGSADTIEAVMRGDTCSRIGPTSLLATDRKAFDRAARTLAARGIVFDLDLSADPAPRKKRTRRRRRW